MTAERNFSFPTLRRRLRKVKTAMTHPVHPDIDNLYVHSAHFHPTSCPGDGFERMHWGHQRATIHFQGWEMGSCTDRQVAELLVVMESLVKQSSEGKSCQPTLFRDTSAANRGYNVLDHEWQHLLGLPQQVRDEAIIGVTFRQSFNIGLHVAGYSYYQADCLLPTQMAEMASRPPTLSNSDIRQALVCARQVGRSFVRKTRRRIESRQMVNPEDYPQILAMFGLK